MEIYEKINELIRKKGITKREFINRFLALSPVLQKTGEVPKERAVYGWLSGRTSMEIDMLPYIADALGVDENTLLGKNEKNYKSTKCKNDNTKEIDVVYGYVGCGNRCEARKSKKECLLFDKRLLDKKFQNRDIKAIVASGDSMSPYVNDGDIVLFEEIFDDVKSDGKYIIETSNGIMLKNLKFNLDGSITISSENPAYPPETVDNLSQEYFSVVGKVVGRVLKN